MTLWMLRPPTRCALSWAESRSGDGSGKALTLAQVLPELTCECHRRRYGYFRRKRVIMNYSSEGTGYIRGDGVVLHVQAFVSVVRWIEGQRWQVPPLTAQHRRTERAACQACRLSVRVVWAAVDAKTGRVDAGLRGRQQRREGNDACGSWRAGHASRQPDSVALDPDRQTDRQASLDLLCVYAAPRCDGRGETVMS
jgi:hypothetical protein